MDASVFYCCIINYHELKSIKLSVVRGAGTLSCVLHSGFHKITIKVSTGLGSHLNTQREKNSLPWCCVNEGLASYWLSARGSPQLLEATHSSLTWPSPQ